LLGSVDALDDAGDSRPDGLDASELDCAPPVLRAIPVRGSGVGDASVDIELPVAVDEPEGTVVNDGELDPDGDAEFRTEPDELGDRFDVLLPVDDEVDELDEPDEPESVGSANANPGVVATADPTPSATANAPTRPT
jgi:hypothetical protein